MRIDPRSLAVLLLLAAAWPVNAHEVLHEVARGRGIAVRAFESDGDVLGDAICEIFSPGDRKSPFQSGRTDRNGWCAFVPDAPGKWRVRVIDETGHGLDLELEADASAAPASAPSGVAFALRPLVGLAAIAAIFGLLLLVYRRKRRAD
jgi:nickel transport protein